MVIKRIIPRKSNCLDCKLRNSVLCFLYIFVVFINKAVALKCPAKQVFVKILKILQSLQENTLSESIFDKVAVLGA